MDNITLVVTFLAALFEQWQGYATGGFMAFLLWGREKFFGGDKLKRVQFAAIVAAWFVFAAFNVWLDERKQLEHLARITSDAQPLTADQEQRMIATLKRHKGNVEIAVHSNDTTGNEFAYRIRSAFTAAGWAVGAGGNVAEGSGRSLRILADGENINTLAESAIQTAFHNAQLRYRLIRVCRGAGLTIEIGEAEDERYPD